MQLRQLNEDGIAEALNFIAHARTNSQPLAVPERLLHSQELSSVVPELSHVEVEPQWFQTRRDVVEYFLPRFGGARHLVADQPGIWSWLGLLNFRTTLWDSAGNMRTTRGWPEDTVFVFQRAGRRWQRRYRHWLWGAWSLYHTHGDQADFLLDLPLTEFSNLSSRIIGVSRIFHSFGIVPLMLQLYTEGGKQKPKNGDGPGGTEHLLRALLQLERTYDVYGMTPEALMHILPPDFDRWMPETP